MAKEVRFDVKVDAADAIRELKQVGQAADKSGDQMAKAFVDASAKSDAAFDKVMNGLKQVTDESKQMLAAVARIGDKMGEGFDPQTTAELVTSLRKAGVEFDTIDAKADDLIATMRDLDSVRVDAAATGLSNIRGRAGEAGTGLDNVTASAQKSRNAFANMVGNAAQDLGALVGVAGSAGVALGQLAEGAQDARNDGEGLGSVLKGLAGTVVPIAAIGIGVGLISSQMAKAKAEAAALDAANRRFADGLSDTIGAAEKMDQALDSAFDVGQAEPLAVAAREFQQALDPEKLLKYQQALAALGLTNQEYVEILAATDGSFQGFVRNMVEGADVTDQLTESQVAAVAAAIDSGDSFKEISNIATEGTRQWILENEQLVRSLEAIDDEAGSQNFETMAKNFLLAQRGVEGETDAVNDAIATTDNYTDALLSYLHTKEQQIALDKQARTELEAQKVMWDSIATATKAATDAEKERHDQLMADVAAKILEDEKLMWESIATGTEDATKAAEEHGMAIAEAADKIGDLIAKAPDLAGALTAGLDEVDAVFEGLKFDVDFQPAMDKALDDLHGFKPDFQTLADEWSTILAGKPVDIFGNVRADDAKFIELTDNIRNLMQTGIVNEFEQGGRDAADTFLQSNAAQIAAASGLTIQEVYRIMGLPPDGSIDAIIAPTIAQDQADKAKGILDALAGVSGDPRIAALQIALLTDNIPADVAYAQSLLLAEDLGIPVTATVTSNADEVAGDIDTATEDRTTQVIVPKSDSLGAMQTLIDHVARDRTIQFITKADNAGATDKILDGLAAERDAVIFARAHNVDATRQILDNLANPGGQPRIATIQVNRVGGGSTGGGAVNGQAAGVTATTAAPTTAAFTPSAVTMTSAPAVAPFTANVTINAGVLGNHFDVERTVVRALRRSARINGARAVRV